MKVYVLRWWKEPVIRRQACLDCGAALDLSAICVIGGDPTQHVYPPGKSSGDGAA